MNVFKLYRNAFGGLSPATWWLSFVMLVNRSGTMVVPFLTLYLTQARHVDITKAGFVMAVFGAGSICGAYLGGRLTDKLGFYKIQLASLLLGGVMFILLGQMTDYYAICATAFVLALLNDAFRPANTSAIAHYSNNQNRTRSFSLNRLAVNLGWALGGTIGGFVAHRNYQALFWIDGLTNIFAAFVLLGVLSPKRSSHTPGKAAPAKPDEAKARSPYKDWIYLVFIFLTVLFSFGFFQLFTTLPVFFKTDLHLEPDVIGMIMGLNGLLIALTEMLLVYRLETLNRNMYLIAVGTALVGTSYLVFLAPGNGLQLALISTVVCTLGEMLSMPFMNTFMVSRTEPTNRGQYAALYSMAWSVAQISGPWTGTILAKHYGFYTVWLIIGSLFLLVTGGFLMLHLFVEREKIYQSISSSK